MNWKRFAQSARPGSEKAWLWELFFAIGGLFGAMFSLLPQHGPGAEKGHFWNSFSLGSEKGPLLEFIFELGKLFGVILGSFFDP